MIQLVSFGLDPLSRCFLLDMDGVRVLLDCGCEIGSLVIGRERILDVSKGPRFVSSVRLCRKGPRLDAISLQTIDAVVISSYKRSCIGCVPSLFNHSSFRATTPVLATEPTVLVGTLQLLDDMQSTTSSSLVGAGGNLSKRKRTQTQRKGVCERSVERDPRRAHKQLESRFKTVRFNEVVRVGRYLEIVALSAGGIAGSSNFVVRNVVTGSHFLYAPEIFSTSLCPKRSVFAGTNMNQLSAFGRGFFDACLAVSTNRGYTASSYPRFAIEIDDGDDEKSQHRIQRPRPARLSDCCDLISVHVEKGSHVIVQATPSTVVFQLIEAVSKCLDADADVEMYWVCSVARQLVAATDGLTEWLSTENRDRVEKTMRLPFPLVELVRSGRLRIFDGAAGLPRIRGGTSPSKFVCFTSLPLPSARSTVDTSTDINVCGDEDFVSDCWTLASGPLAVQRAFQYNLVRSAPEPQNLLLRVWENSDADVTHMHSCAECFDCRHFRCLDVVLDESGEKFHNDADDDDDDVEEDGAAAKEALLSEIRGICRHIVVAKGGESIVLTKPCGSLGGCSVNRHVLKSLIPLALS
eukprot:g4976.t1